MAFVYIFLVVLIIAIIYGAAKGINQVNALNKKVKELGANDGIMVTHVEGLGLGANAPCEVFRFDDRVLIDAKTHKFEIQLDQLRAAVVKSEQELIEKGKSVVGRAVIGTLLIPGLGTIVGGMSGIGNKKKKGKTSHYLIFNYMNSKGELSAVTFQDAFTLIINKFCNDINKSMAPAKEVIQL